MKQLVHQDARQFPLCAVQGNPPFAQKRPSVHFTTPVPQPAYLMDVERRARKLWQEAQDGLDPAPVWMRNQ